MCAQNADIDIENKDVIAPVFLLFGKTGWIGGKLEKLLEREDTTYHVTSARLEDREAICAVLDHVKPTHVLNAAGVTGRPNVDWCETHKPETIRANIIGCLNLVDLCHEKDIHCTVFATGCIYEYDKHHPIGSGRGFTENDPPNFAGSFYSQTKIYLESMLRVYKNCLILRLRMPISDDLEPRSFITKITKYEKVINVPNSMTVLTELLPVSIYMAKKHLTGVYNFTNPGAISHNEILDLFKKYIDPNFNYINFSIEEQNKILMAPRSNNELDVSKLLRDVPTCQITPIHEAMHAVFARMAKSREGP